MIGLGIVLAAVMGIVLGLLGGGGSILTVPILVYALELGAREAIATSLLVVGVTSLAGALQHARRGNVDWRTGLLFGVVAMVGAYGGGLLAGLFAGSTLLMLFAGLMVVTGVAMLVRRAPAEASTTPAGPHRMRPARIVADGLVVGGVTGLVGAGGGFLVVPALVLLGGMEMRLAIGTSLLVIAMKSFAGLAGHLNHVSIDLQLAGAVTVAAVAGSFVGARLTTLIEPARLRTGFAWFVLVMAGVMVAQELPASAYEAILVDRWPFWAGGAAIGLFLLAFLLLGRRVLGVSTGFVDACAAPFSAAARRSWRLPFLGGIVGGGFLAVTLGGGWAPTLAMGSFDTLVGGSLALKALAFTGGGVLIGFGTRLAGGCTSGHGITGMAQLAPSSLIATAAFMSSGFVVTHLLLLAVQGV